MARLRKGVCYRKLERPYTRVSKFKKNAYIKTTYNTRITRFVMGNTKKQDWEYVLRLISKADLQLRDNSIESARLSSNRLLEKGLGPNSYFLRVVKYPFHILRLHALATGAGADRFSTGMAHSFGKPSGQAAQFGRGDSIFEIYIDKKNIEIAKKALKRASHKIACSCIIDIRENK